MLIPKKRRKGNRIVFRQFLWDSHVALTSCCCCCCERGNVIKMKIINNNISQAVPWYTCALCEMFEGIRYHKSTAPHTAVNFTFFSTFFGLSLPGPCQLFVALKIACCSRKFNKVSQVVIRDAWSYPKIPSSYRYTFATLHHIIVEDVRSVDSHMMTIFIKWNEISSHISLTHTATRDVIFLVILKMYKRRKDRLCVYSWQKPHEGIWNEKKALRHSCILYCSVIRRLLLLLWEIPVLLSFSSSFRIEKRSREHHQEHETCRTYIRRN